MRSLVCVRDAKRPDLSAAKRSGAVGSSAAKRPQIGMSDVIDHYLSLALEAVVPRSYPRVALDAAAARSFHEIRGAGQACASEASTQTTGAPHLGGRRCRPAESEARWRCPSVHHSLTTRKAVTRSPYASNRRSRAAFSEGCP